MQQKQTRTRAGRRDLAVCGALRSGFTARTCEKLRQLAPPMPLCYHFFHKKAIGCFLFACRNIDTKIVQLAQCFFSAGGLSGVSARTRCQTHTRTVFCRLRLKRSRRKAHRPGTALSVQQRPAAPPPTGRKAAPGAVGGPAPGGGCAGWESPPSARDVCGGVSRTLTTPSCRCTSTGRRGCR